MSSQITKFGLLSFLTTALAAPFHPAGYSVGTGAPYGLNTTGPYAPTGSGLPSLSYTATETLTSTHEITETVVRTVYATAASSAASVEAAAVSSAASGAEVCGAETITVTAKTAITVTVTPGVAPSAPSSAVAPVALSSSSAIIYKHGHHHSHSSRSSEAAAASSAAYTAPAYSAPAYSAPVVSSASAPVASTVVPVSSVAAVSTAVPVSSAAAAYSAVSAAAYSAVSAEAYSAVSAAASSVVVSSAKASATVTAQSSGGKRGLAYNDASLTSCFEKDSSVISWGYNWAQVSDGLSSTFEYMPMLIDLRDMFTSTWETNWKAALASGSTSFLSFNEPDLSSQANLSPTAAATAHKLYMNPIKAASSSAKISTPAVTNGGTGMGLDWLASWQTECGGACDYDAVAIHWYDAATNLAYFKQHVTQANTQTGKPVWVTEFGATGSDADIQSFLKEAMEWMDSQDFVERYAYFMVDNGGLVSGTETSALGTVYAATS